MHTNALEWIRCHVTDEPVTVLDIGGRNINGSPRPLFPYATTYTVLDIADGPGVDIVADAAEWKPDREYDVVVCAEVFEHTPVWPEICETAYLALRPGGRLIVTCAGPGRNPHSAVDGGDLRPGEHYGNVDPGELRAALEEFFADVVVDQQTNPADVRAVATKAG